MDGWTDILPCYTITILDSKFTTPDIAEYVINKSYWRGGGAMMGPLAPLGNHMADWKKAGYRQKV